MTIYITELSADDYGFPSPYLALDEPNGLLAFGGDLSPVRIINAYRHGIFPWYGPGEPILWWSPSPRAVFIPETFTPAKSLKKYQKKVSFRVSINHATDQVIDYCAQTRPAEQTWLNADMRNAYKSLAAIGVCHSVEVWNQSDELVGGLYGLSFGRLFCGESMFSLETNASKVALWHFCEHFSRHHGELIDCQVMNPHLASLGAIEIGRQDFLQQVTKLQMQPIDISCFEKQWLADDQIN